MGQSYEERLRRVVRYIHDNPAGDLSLDALADVAALSRFHWHRIFHAMTGETCAEAVRRIRINRAAFWLAQTVDPIDKIAARAGYDNPNSFARTFREIYGVTPLAFRKTGTPMGAPLILKTGGPTMYDVTIETRDPLRLATLEHVGPYTEIGRTFEQLTALFTARNLWPFARGTAGVYPDDPSAVPADELRSYAGVIVSPEFEMPEDLREVEIAGGKHAILHLKGPYTGLKAAYEHLYGQWFAQSGEEPADGPPFEVYLNLPYDTAPSDLRTDICAPLK